MDGIERTNDETKTLTILTYPDDLLEKECVDLTFPIESATNELIVNMFQTMMVNRGVGLAAPQVGVLENIIVYVNIKDITPVVIINPKIIACFGRAKSLEGCLSVPGFFGRVKRFKEIVVLGMDEKGEELRLKARGMQAYIIQHEIDHLRGMEFIDRLVDKKDITDFKIWCERRKLHDDTKRKYQKSSG